MIALLWVVVWCLIGAAQTAFILGKLDADVDCFEAEWIGVFSGVALWPVVTILVIVWYPAKVIYNFAKPKA